MNYCIKAADVVEYDKIQMGILPARKENKKKADDQKSREVLPYTRIAFKKKESDIVL